MNNGAKLKLPCVILSGGKSSRMGSNKALLPFGGYSSLAHFQHARMCEIFEYVYISCKNPLIFDFDADFITDNSEIFSPMLGIWSAFFMLKCEEIFFITVDAPLVSKESICKIVDSHTANSFATIAKTPLKMHCLIGIYRAQIMPSLEESIKKQSYRLQAMLSSTPHTLVEFDSERNFTNLNTKEEYEALLVMDSSKN